MSPRSSRLRPLRVFFLLLGVVVLVAVFWKAGWGPVSENLGRIGWWFFALLAFWILPQAAFVEGWRHVVTPRPPGRSFPRLAGAYLAGDAVNYVGASIAGEPVRAYLLRPEVSGAAAFASINLRKHADLAGQFALLALGLVWALAAYPLPPFLATAAVVGAAFVGTGLALMTWGLRRGSFAPISRRLGALGLASRLEGLHRGAAEVDEALRLFYSEHPRRLAAAVFWSFAGWCGGLVETWLILRLLGLGADWGTALAIEALTQALNTLLIFIPGRLGGAEGVRAGVFLALGLPGAAGAAYALARRAREVVWLVPGVLVLVRRHATSLLKPGAAAPETDAGDGGRPGEPARAEELGKAGEAHP